MKSLNKKLHLQLHSLFLKWWWNYCCGSSNNFRFLYVYICLFLSLLQRNDYCKYYRWLRFLCYAKTCIQCLVGCLYGRILLTHIAQTLSYLKHNLGWRIRNFAHYLSTHFYWLSEFLKFIFILIVVKQKIEQNRCSEAL